MTARGCEKCDAERRRDGNLHRMAQPCDICAGRGFDYIGRPCRHCALAPSEPLNQERQ